jgi:hypothetical protein
MMLPPNTKHVAWWRRSVALLAALGGAGWVAFGYFDRYWSSREVIFLCLLALIFYELMRLGRGGRGG